MTAATVPFQAATLRHVFAAFPTGVTVLASRIGTERVGTAVNSFTSVSLCWRRGPRANPPTDQSKRRAPTAARSVNSPSSARRTPGTNRSI